MRDLAVALGLPVLIAAAPGLGTINHTLLTLDAARAAGLDVRAVVLTPWPEQPSELERSNRDDDRAARATSRSSAWVTWGALTVADLARAGDSAPMAESGSPSDAP